MLKKLLFFLSNNSALIDQQNILNLVEKNSEAKVLDLGCGNGRWTKKIIEKISSKNVTGIDILAQKISGFKFIKSDLNHKFPFPNNSFDVVSANQVIEHIENTDNFISEIKRVLKHNGYAIISTENLSSWHNIFALLLGWQPFSIDHHHPFSHLTVPVQPKHGHVKAFSYFGLQNLFKKHGFKIESLKSAGYFKFQNLIDPLHCHHITIKVRKN